MVSKVLSFLLILSGFPVGAWLVSRDGEGLVSSVAGVFVLILAVLASMSVGIKLYDSLSRVAFAKMLQGMDLDGLTSKWTELQQEVERAAAAKYLDRVETLKGEVAEAVVALDGELSMLRDRVKAEKVLGEIDQFRATLDGLAKKVGALTVRFEIIESNAQASTSTDIQEVAEALFKSKKKKG